MSGTWKEEVTTAQHLLGTGGKLPKPSFDPTAYETGLIKAKEAFSLSKQDLEKKLLTLTNALTIAKNNFKQYRDMVEGDDFGLDDKDPEQKKRIDATSKSILGWLTDTQSRIDKHVEELSKLDRAITDVRRLDGIKL